MRFGRDLIVDYSIYVHGKIAMSFRKDLTVVDSLRTQEVS